MVGWRRDFWLSRSIHKTAHRRINSASNASYTLNYIDTSTFDSWRRLSFSGSQTLDSRTLRLLAETTAKHDEAGYFQERTKHSNRWVGLVAGKKEGCMVTNVVQHRREAFPHRRNVLVTWLRDLRLFGSLCMARFIVWRELHRERKQRSPRRQLSQRWQFTRRESH